MKRFLIVSISLLLAAVSSHAQIFRGIKFPKGGRIDAFSASWAPETVELLNVKAMRPIYRAAQQNFSQNYLFQSAQRGLVQIKAKKGGEVMGTGFLVMLNNVPYIATARHVGGRVGNTVVAEVFNEHGSPLEFKVQMVAGGQRGIHSADVALAALPPEALRGGAKPFTWAAPDLKLPAFSLGYTEGLWKHRDILPMERRFLSAGQWDLIGTRPALAQENPDEPFGFSGYCGSPVLQLQANRWKVVGVHVGSCGIAAEPEKNRSFAVNLSETLPLLDRQLHGEKLAALTRPVKIFGQEVGQLDWEERVAAIQVYGENRLLFEKQLNGWDQVYSDEHVEWLLDEVPWQSGDLVIILIERRRGSVRDIEYTIP